MTDRPILFSAPMVRALLDGRKTQTRRIIKDAPTAPGWILYSAEGKQTWLGPNGYPSMPCTVRFAKGDRLWVRENWHAPRNADDVKPRDMDATWKICPAVDWNYADWGIKGRLRPGIHMPRWASRLTLTVTDVRVQRLQEISEADCIAEGVETVADNFGNGAAYRDYGLPDRADSAEWYRRPIDSFRSLWVKINGGASWVASPWVVALTFTVERRNIDA